MINHKTWFIPLIACFIISCQGTQDQDHKTSSPKLPKMVRTEVDSSVKETASLPDTIVEKTTKINDIEQIRVWFKEIEERLTSCKKLTVEWEAGPYAEVIGYYDENVKKIIKIDFHDYGDWSDHRTSYYFHHDQLIFIFSNTNQAKEFFLVEELKSTEQERWQQGPLPKKIAYSQDRKYFKNHTCLQYLTKQKTLTFSPKKENTYPKEPLTTVKNKEVAVTNVNVKQEEATAFEYKKALLEIVK